MGEWKKLKLSEVSDIITGFPFKSNEYETEGKLRVVRGENVTIGNLRWDTCKVWNHPTLGLEKYFLRKRDIVIGMDGSRVGSNRSQVKENELPLILAQRVACIRARTNFNQDFLWYCIYSDHFKDYVEAIHTGTSIPHISQNQIGDFIIKIPIDYIEQQAIASILSSLDDKIDLLHRQNATLEKMAETLFRQWFVEEAKEEWGTTILKRLGTVVTGKTPNTANNEFWGYDIPFITPTDFKNNGKYFLKADRQLSNLGMESVQNSLISKGSILVTCIGSDMGKVAITFQASVTNQQINSLILKDDFPSYEYIYQYLKSIYPLLQSMASSGSTMPIINKSDFENIEIPMPPEDILRCFEKISLAFNDKILSNTNQIHTLTHLRDTLLPKLMSGEVRVKYQEKNKV